MAGIRAKLAFYFVLLGLLPAAAALIGLSALAAHDRTAQTDGRLETELRSAVRVTAGPLAAAEARAAAVARDPELTRLIRAHDMLALRDYVRRRPGLAVVANQVRV